MKSKGNWTYFRLVGSLRYPSSSFRVLLYAYHITDGFHISTPLPSEFPKMGYPACPLNPIVVKPPPIQIFPFFHVLGITGRVCKYAQFGLFYTKIFQMTLLLHFRTAGYRGNHYDPWKFWNEILKK